MDGIMSLYQRYSGSQSHFECSLAEAMKLVRSVESAICTGQGDCRSNAVILRLLAFANAWIDLQPVIALPQTELDRGVPTPNL
jgi:hypothetical protein